MQSNTQVRLKNDRFAENLHWAVRLHHVMIENNTSMNVTPGVTAKRPCYKFGRGVQITVFVLIR